MSNQYHDMELRVLNASPCPAIRRRPGESFSYGNLYIHGEGQPLATFGDLTVPVTDEQANFLVALAKDRSIYKQR